MHMYYKFIVVGFWTSASDVYVQNAISNYISEGKCVVHYSAVLPLLYCRYNSLTMGININMCLV